MLVIGSFLISSQNNDMSRGLIAGKNVKILVTSALIKKHQNSLFLKSALKNEFFKDMEIYQTKPN